MAGGEQSAEQGCRGSKRKMMGNEALVESMLWKGERIKGREYVQLAGRALRSLMLVIWISKRILLAAVAENH